MNYQIHLNIGTCIYVYVCICICIWLYVDVYVYVYMYICVCANVYMFMYVQCTFNIVNLYFIEYIYLFCSLISFSFNC